MNDKKAWSLLITLCSILFSHVRAETVDITPQGCVRLNAQQPCQIALKVRLRNRDTADVDSLCFALQGQPQGCSPLEDGEATFDIALTTTTALEVLTPQGEVLQHQLLTVKELKKPTRRRVKRPWSLF